MPEVIERKMVCDKPRCSNTGRRYIIDDGEQPRQMILCDPHAGNTSVTDAMEIGEPAPLASIRTRRTRGLSRDRLHSLISDE